MKKFSPILPPAFVGENFIICMLIFFLCKRLHIEDMANFTAFCELGVMFIIAIAVVMMVECLVVVMVLVTVIFISFVTVSVTVEMEMLVVAEMLGVVCVAVTVDVWVMGVALAQKLLRNLSTSCSH